MTTYYDPEEFNEDALPFGGEDYEPADPEERVSDGVIEYEQFQAETMSDTVLEQTTIILGMDEELDDGFIKLQATIPQDNHAAHDLLVEMVETQLARQNISNQVASNTREILMKTRATVEATIQKYKDMAEQLAQIEIDLDPDSFFDIENEKVAAFASMIEEIEAENWRTSFQDHLSKWGLDRGQTEFFIDAIYSEDIGTNRFAEILQILWEAHELAKTGKLQ